VGGETAPAIRLQFDKQCTCLDCACEARTQCGSASSGVEPLTVERGIGIVGSSNRGIRGGSWNNNSNNLSSSIRNNNNPTNENNNIGFRVASPDNSACASSL